MEDTASLGRRTITSAGGVERTNNSTSTSLGIDLASSLKRCGVQVPEQGRSLTKSSFGEFRSRSVKEGTEHAKAAASECSMCGDVGFAQQLLLCRRCGSRFQHTYCSKLYPDLDMESWACEWCLYEVDKNAVGLGIGAAKSRLGKRKAVSLSLTESRHKAFEFLLQIAQASPTSSSSTANNTAGDKRSDTGDCGRAETVAKKEDGPEVGYGYGHKEESSWRLGHAENWNCKDEDGVKKGAQVSKRQRCGHPSKALDKWRNLPKTKLHCNTSKAIGRRYKLLADVLC